MTATATCSGCGAAVLSAPALGRLLDVEPHPLGVFLPVDGGRAKTVREALDGVDGHHTHRCRPPEQGALFEGSA